MPKPIAYLPLDTYPEAAPDAAVQAALAGARALGAGLHVSAFAVDIPPMAKSFGGYLMDADGLARAAEERSLQEASRLSAMVERAGTGAEVIVHRCLLGGAQSHAAGEARYFDLAVLPWAADHQGSQDMAQALVFEAGVPVVLVPPGTGEGRVDHIAIAWDESRVAARALNEALRFLPAGGRISVLTVGDEKALARQGIAHLLAKALEARGYGATAVEVALQGRPIGLALQQAALDAGAQMLAMGGFGHSRLRDFILGGATKGVLSDLRLPVLLAH